MLISLSNPPECVLVMPIYNEEACIETVLRMWVKELTSQFDNSFQIVVINDGSKDRTGEILDSLSVIEPRVTVIHQVNGGHGVAVLRGYRKALTYNSKFIFQVDSDDQFDPSDFKLLWDLREDSKFILGFRAHRNDAFHRFVITNVLRILILSLFGIWIKDSNIPYRLIRSDYLAFLLDVIPESPFAPNIFLSIAALMDGQNLKSVPVHHRKRETGTVSILKWKLLRVCFRSFSELLKFKVSVRQKLKSKPLIRESV